MHAIFPAIFIARGIIPLFIINNQTAKINTKNNLLDARMKILIYIKLYCSPLRS
jgi:hypothetical protein